MDLIREHRRGLTHNEVTDALREVVAAIATERKTGKLSIEITMAPRAKGEGVDVSIAVNAKPPKPEAGSSIFFISPNNELTRDDPRQTNMELREIGPAAAYKGVA